MMRYGLFSGFVLFCLKENSNLTQTLIFLEEQGELEDVWAQEFCCCNFDQGDKY